MARSRMSIILWPLLGFSALVASIIFFNGWNLLNWACFRIRSDLLTANTLLSNENERLKRDLDELLEKNQRLKQVFANRVLQDSVFSETGEVDRLPAAQQTQNPIEELSEELLLNQQIYRAMLAEKKRWDEYLQDQYREILESPVEPIVVDSQYLTFKSEANRVRFNDIESVLNLHKRLIRDVRLFHDEVKYRQKVIHEDPAYQLYDLKFNLESFAVESAIADALQQAMSTVGVGIYQQEAKEVMERLGEEFVRPIKDLAEWLEDPTDSPNIVLTNYHFYVVFGKKVLNYADYLARQTLIPLAPSALGELDFFSRTVAQSLKSLDEAADLDNIDLMHQNMETPGQ